VGLPNFPVLQVLYGINCFLKVCLFRVNNKCTTKDRDELNFSNNKVNAFGNPIKSSAVTVETPKFIPQFFHIIGRNTFNSSGKKLAT
tara:strand:+ start:703 stop:963 length:261 start_codon:yes stop_codon:yes gene_type:complete